MRLIREAGWPVVILLAACLAGPTGCSAPARSAEDAFSEVAGEVESRTGHRVEWDRGSTEDAAAAAVVQGLWGDGLTMDEAVQMALLRDPALQAEFENIGIAQSDLVDAGLLENPVFHAAAKFPDGGSGGTKVELSVVESFLEVFTIPPKRELAETQLNAVTARVTQSVLHTAHSAATAYLEFQAARQGLELARTEREIADAAAEMSRRQQEAGNLNDLEAAKRAAAAGEAGVAVRMAEADVVSAKAKLSKALGGVSMDLSTAVADEFAPVPETEIPLEAATWTALVRRPDLAAARLDSDIVAKALQLTRSNLLTRVELGVDAEHEPDGTWLTGPSVEMPIPLFDHRGPAIARLEAQWRQSERRREAMEADIRLSVEEAHARLTAARAAAAHYRDVVIPWRERITAMVLQQNHAMIGSVYELLDAKGAETAARRQLIEAMHVYWQARVDLESAIGGAGSTADETWIVPVVMGETGPKPESAPAVGPGHGKHEHHH